MKVLYFFQHFSTAAGSTSLRSYEMAQRLIASGHEVTMVCGSYADGVSGLTGPFSDGWRRGSVDGIDVIEFDLPYANRDRFIKRVGTFLKFAYSGSRLALTESYDILVASSTPLTAGIPGIVARALRRKPFVFEVRDLWPELPRAMGVIKNPFVLGAMSLLEWTTYHSAQRLVGLAPGIVDGIVRRNISTAAVTMIPNGCDLDIFADGIEPWRPNGVRPDDLLAVYAGSHGIANGLGAVLATAAELKARRRDDIRLLLIGEGRLKPILQEQARQQGLDNVLFHPQIPKRRLAGLLAGADVGMQLLANVPAFYYGTSPNKFFDYLAAGLPVLNNYPGWLSELIEQEDCGFVVAPDSPTAFADALVRAADDRQELTRKGRRAYSLGARQFDRKALSESWVEWVTGVATS